MGDIRRAAFEYEPTDDELRLIEEARKQRDLEIAESYELLKYQEFDCTPFGDIPLLSNEELRQKLEKNKI